MSQVSSDRVEFLVKQLGIPEHMNNTLYPFYELNGTGNIFGDIAIATKAWRKVDAKVSKNIMSVIDEHCTSPEEVDALLQAISGLDYP